MITLSVQVKTEKGFCPATVGVDTETGEIVSCEVHGKGHDQDEVRVLVMGTSIDLKLLPMVNGSLAIKAEIARGFCRLTKSANEPANSP